VGVAVLCWTAAQMIVNEPVFADYFTTHASARVGAYALVFVLVFGAGFVAQRRRPTEAAQAA
jgi:predicted tellurium resistance membrane protein TerC